MTHDNFGLVGQQIEQKYEVESVLGSGGFGVVYQATHRALRKPVALKVLRVSTKMDATTRKRFIEDFFFEARTVAMLEHPSIVRVLDCGASLMPTGERVPWMALEWVDGQTLADHLKARRGAGGREPQECLALLRPIFEALAHAHALGVVHRDIKPANLMLPKTLHGWQGELAIRLLDFGIAKIMDPDTTETPSGKTITHASVVAYSLPYASPEQVSRTRTGPWTDVHALGLVLTELLTDTAPLSGSDEVDFHAEILAQRRPTPARFGVDVGAWEPVLARATALKAGERYANAGEFLAALEADVPMRAHRREFEATVPTSALVAPVPVATKVTATEPWVPPLAVANDRKPPNTGWSWRHVAAIGALTAAGVLLALRVYPGGDQPLPSLPPQGSEDTTHASTNAPPPARPPTPPQIVPHPPPAVPTTDGGAATRVDTGATFARPINASARPTRDGGVRPIHPALPRPVHSHSSIPLDAY